MADAFHVQGRAFWRYDLVVVVVVVGGGGVMMFAVLVLEKGDEDSDGRELVVFVAVIGLEDG